MTPDEDLQREIAFHIDQRTRDLVMQGIAPAEAGRRARIEFGRPAQVQEDCRGARRRRLWNDLRADLRFALRLARRTPVLTATTILALTLGIGATSAMFAVINGVLLKPLPYRSPSQLTM